MSSDAAARPRVAAVVLTWNDTRLAGACIESVLANTHRPLDVVLVDNGSKTPCGEELKSRFGEIRTCVLPVNQGFTGGSNAGLEAGLALGAPYVMLLNNDTVLAPDAIGRLVDAMEADPRAGAASALILDVDGRTVQFHTATVNRDAARHVHHDSEIPHAGREWPTVETEFAPACAILFRASALREVGLFDRSFGTNWEDYDLCLRFRDRGWKLLAVGAAEVRHHHGATTGRVSPYITYYFTRNRLICLFRYGRAVRILRNAPIILRSFWWQVRGYGLGNWACHRAFARGVLHFLFGVRGEASSPTSRADRGA